MKISREKLHKILKVAECGLTTREILEQSNAFIFTEKHLITFNGEILTRAPNPLPDIEGAVEAGDLQKVLIKYPDEEVDVVLKGEDLVVKGKRRATGMTRHAKILLPYQDVPKPGKWKPLPEALINVLQMASKICGKDETQPLTTAVHVTPELVEASDNFRMFRHEAETGFKKETLIPATSVECLSTLAFTHVSLKSGWVHFKTASDHEVSVRCSNGVYPDLGPLLTLGEVQKIKLPKDLKNILNRAETMQETAYDAIVHISIDSGELVLKASKKGGWHKESKKIKYSGAPLAFQVHPKFLEDILAQTNEVMVGNDRMRIETKNAIFVVCMEMLED